MPRRRRRYSDECCARCDNEIDLVAWGDGTLYCFDCLACPCGKKWGGEICLLCFRLLHTIVCGDGPRIRDLTVYAACGIEEYGLDPFELRLWRMDEEEKAMVLFGKFETYRSNPNRDVNKPPPHHRFTASGENR